jgi:anti-anti-sigma factor
MQHPLNVTMTQKGQWNVAALRGDLDMETAADLEQRCAAVDDRLAIEMSGVRFIDSSGLRSLVQLNHSREHVVLLDPSAVVRRLLSLTEMTDVFEIVDDLPALDA